MASVDMEVNRKKASPASDDTPTNLFVPLNKFPQMKATFRIEKIKKQILSYSSFDTLLEFRHISREWRVCSTKEIMLRSKTRISIIPDELDEKFIYASSNGKTVSIQEMRSKFLFPSTPLLFSFPCSTFTIYYGHKIGRGKGVEDEIDEFFNNCGKGIRKLKLYVFFSKTFNETVVKERMCSHEKNWLKQFITKLILKQAPNLVEIELDIVFKNFFLCNWGIPCEHTEPMIKYLDMEDRETWGNFNWNFRSVTFDHMNDRNQVFEFVRELTPNLKEVKTRDLNFYLESPNRLRFLKELSYSPRFPDVFHRNEIIKKIVNLDGDLQLEELRIVINVRAESWNEVTNICNKIFEKNCHSLKKLCWTRLGFLPGLCIPQMPNAKYVYFSDIRETLEDFFPTAMCLSKIFPKLHTIALYFSPARSGGDKKVLGRCKIDVMPSVKVIVLKFYDFLDFESLQKWFPNAHVEDKTWHALCTRTQNSDSGDVWESMNRTTFY